LGIDTAASEIERRQVQGYDVAVPDAQSFELGRKFAVIVTADFIEHLGNSGVFPERGGEHLQPGGLRCFVTPNALSLNNDLKSLARLRVGVNAEHICWYDWKALRKLLAHGFQPVDEYSHDDQTHPLAFALRLRRSLAAHLIMIAGPSKTAAVSVRVGRRTALALLFVITVFNLLLRYPQFPHEVGVDSFFAHTLSVAIVSDGYAKWISNPFSYFGWYPLSYPSADPFLLSSTSVLGNINVEESIFIVSILLGPIGILSSFLMAREFRESDLFALGTAALYGLAPRFLE